MSADTSKRDGLFRTLYLRREYGQLAARSRLMAVESADADPDGGAGTNDPLELGSLRDVLLLPPPGIAAATSGALGFPGAVASLKSPAQLQGQQQRQLEVLQGQCWRGLIYVRHRDSPWYGAVFAFLVHFPERYPFEGPVLLLEHPLRSHPLLSRPGMVRDGASSPPAVLSTPALANLGVVVPFLHEVYCSVDPMRVSVMALVLRHLKQFFYPTAWPAWWGRGSPTSVRSGGDVSSAQGGGTYSPKLSPPPPLPSGAPQLLMQPSVAAAHPRVNRMLARRDVKKYGLLHRGDVVLGRPYVDLVADDVTQQLLEWFQHDVETAVEGRRRSQLGEAVHEERKARRLADSNDPDAAVVRWSEWYGRVLLPHMLVLP